MDPKMQKPLIMAVIAVVAVMILIAVLLMQKPAQPPITPSVGLCASSAECSLHYSCCGSPIRCDKSPSVVREQCPQGLMCAAPRPEMRIIWNYTRCECLNGNCTMSVDRERACPAMCEFYKESVGGYVPDKTFWESNCPGKTCEALGGGVNPPGGRNLSAEYDALVERCQMGAQDADDVYGAIEGCMAASPLVAEYQNWCESSGGYFGQLGRMSIKRCNPAASNAGKTCLGNDECGGWCEVELTPEQDEAARNGQTFTGITGKCSQYQYVFGCRPVLENGTIESYICID